MWIEKGVYVVRSDSMPPGNIDSDKVDSGKVHDLNQPDNNLLPCDPCKDARAFTYGGFLGNKHYQNYPSDGPNFPQTLKEARSLPTKGIQMKGEPYQKKHSPPRDHSNHGEDSS